MIRFLRLLACVISVTLLAGCETTSQGIPARQLRANVTQIKIGMSKPQVLALIGKPIRVNELVDESGRKEQWIYAESQFWTAGQAFAAGLATGGYGPVREGAMALTFTNDRLTSMEKRQ